MALFPRTILGVLLAMLCLDHWVSQGPLASADTFLPPRVSSPRETVRVKEGQTKVVLECQLDVGNDPVAYKWFKQYRWVTADLGFAYRTYRKVQLALHTITRRHEGTYECVASNDAGTDATSIEVIVEPGDFSNSVYGPRELPDTTEVLSELAASLNDVLAEGECSCDLMFLMHASPDAANETLAAQANFLYTVAQPIVSKDIRVAAVTYSDYANSKMSLGKGTSPCALTKALGDLTHEKWATRIQPVLRDAVKKMRKSKKACKVLFLPIFGSLGAEGADPLVSNHLKKLGVKIFILEVTPAPIVGVGEMASKRGDGKQYHWWIPIKVWPTIVSYMTYMPEELSGCQANRVDIEGSCVGEGGNCTQSDQCRGSGFGCIQGTCQSMQCNVRPEVTGCCSSPGEFWCGDVTLTCQSRDFFCDGKIQCMNGRDEENCWQITAPCKEGEARCQSSTLCLSMYDLCDGEPHCPGAEDEDPKFCRSFPCPVDRPFRCRNGKCIATDSLCDGTFRDCSDGEDENLEYCSERHVCPSTRPFKCDYGICIPERMVCDGAFNCLDALDERLCEERSCPPERPFKCGDGKCVDIALVCNGVVDACLDGWDERNCTEFICPSDRSFKCLSGRCIDKWLECDKRDDCGDGSDEMNCDDNPTTTPTSRPPSHPPISSPAPTHAPIPPKPTKESCLETEFYCPSGACLSKDKVCDGRRNCIDAEDEDPDMCRSYPCPAETPFRCPDGVCVRVEFCDGLSDCSDGSDEEDCDEDIDETIIEEEEEGGTGDVSGNLEEKEPTTDLEDAMLVTKEDGHVSGAESRFRLYEILPLVPVFVVAMATYITSF